MIDFNFDINDNLEVNEDYTGQQAGNKPPLPGNYAFRVEKWDYAKNRKTGELVLYKDNNGDPKYPVIQLTTATIVEPLDAERGVTLFQQVPSNPYERDGKIVSRAADLLKALNPTASAANTGEVLRQLSDALNAGITLKGRLDYEAYDKDAAAAAVEALPVTRTKKQEYQAKDKASVRGWRNIMKANKLAGKPTLPPYKWVGPSGKVIDARPVLTVFFPGDEDVILGPDKALAAL